MNGDTVLIFKSTVSDGKGGRVTDDVKIRIKDKAGDNSQLVRDLAREPIPQATRRRTLLTSILTLLLVIEKDVIYF